MPYLNSPEWLAATEEGRLELIFHARTRDLTFYEEFANQVTSFHFDGGHDPRLWNLLYNISVSEAEAGRPLLSALVIRKDTGQPGNGFFELAAERRRDITDRDRCWADEVRLVQDYWRDH